MSNLIYVLAYAPHNRELAVAEAINDAGGLAVAPTAWREVRDYKQRGKHVWAEVPALSNYIFCAITPKEYHQMSKGFLIHGRRIRPRVVREILPAEWKTVQAFAQWAEQERLLALEWFARKDDPNFGFKPGDTVKLLSESLRDTIGEFTRAIMVKGKAKIEVEIEIMGRPVRAIISPDQVVMA